uniref:Uncharacterized protein n=1 Tax=Chlamydomonas leiostraca TaxID=1034604 RepID=A0A7S0RCT2_9CHLO|mmetsp:Transcript_19632/g.49885  ORF Transcript_19632/g.49885 Transcript_19632/m.49885 type:complete len:235 (+) Transcript_19632:244-948(+)
MADHRIAVEAASLLGVKPSDVGYLSRKERRKARKAGSRGRSAVSRARAAIAAAGYTLDAYERRQLWQLLQQRYPQEQEEQEGLLDPEAGPSSARGASQPGGASVEQEEDSVEPEEPRPSFSTAICLISSDGGFKTLLDKAESLGWGVISIRKALHNPRPYKAAQLSLSFEYLQAIGLLGEDAQQEQLQALAQQISDLKQAHKEGPDWVKGSQAWSWEGVPAKCRRRSASGMLVT